MTGLYRDAIFDALASAHREIAALTKEANDLHEHRAANLAQITALREALEGLCDENDNAAYAGNTGYHVEQAAERLNEARERARAALKAP